jgi:N-methylhydantoinase A
MTAHPLRLAVDIGGTFTDVALGAPGARVTAKVLTTPEAPERGVMQGVAMALSKAGFRLADVDLVVHGTTLATNALIERKGAITALITTAGFRDTVEIGYEHRFEQYDVNLDKPQPLVPRRLRYTVPQRVDARGAALSDPPGRIRARGRRHPGQPYRTRMRAGARAFLSFSHQ